MSLNLNIKENLETIFNQLEKFLKTETVVGEPIKIGETTIVPFVSVSFGMGTGGGDGTDGKGNGGIGGGAGSGAKIAPTAVLVIQDRKVELLPMKKSGGLDKLLDMVPGIVEKVNASKCCGEDKE